MASWSEDGTTFLIKDTDAFPSILPHYFNHNNISSFVRQLNFYGKLSNVVLCWGFLGPQSIAYDPDPIHLSVSSPYCYHISTGFKKISKLNPQVRDHVYIVMCVYILRTPGWPSFGPLFYIFIYILLSCPLPIHPLHVHQYIANKIWEFKHERFLKGRPNLLSSIRRATHGKTNACLLLRLEHNRVAESCPFLFLYA